MKKIISIVCVLALVSAGAYAQNQKKEGKGKDWKEKVRTERIAFLTNELDLSEAEAQALWPVYNQVQKDRREAFHQVMEAYKALDEAGEGNVAELLDNYVKAKSASDQLERDAVERYKAVLPIEKVGRLVVAEEKFRHVQIDRLGKGGPGPRREEKNSR